jgi:hypothetical protein
MISGLRFLVCVASSRFSYPFFFFSFLTEKHERKTRKGIGISQLYQNQLYQTSPGKLHALPCRLQTGKANIKRRILRTIKKNLAN